MLRGIGILGSLLLFALLPVVSVALLLMVYAILIGLALFVVVIVATWIGRYCGWWGSPVR